MLGRTDVRMIWSGASVGEGAELRVDGDKGIDAGFDLGFEFLIGDLTDDAVANVAPGESGGRRRKVTFTQRLAQPELSTPACEYTPSLSPTIRPVKVSNHQLSWWYGGEPLKAV